MFALSTISSGLDFRSINHTSIYENFELKVFKNITFLGEISDNWPNNLFGKNVFRTPEPCW